MPSALLLQGFGQTHVLTGGHIAMEEFFRWQIGTFGRAGSVCPGWSSEQDKKTWSHSRELSKVLPSTVREHYCQSDETSVPSRVASDNAAQVGGGGGGQRVPKPTPLLLQPGDAAIATFLLPHAGSANDRGPDRLQMIFRFVPAALEKIKAGQPNTFPEWQKQWSGSDGGGGGKSWFPVSPDEVSDWRAHLIDCWQGWQGMQEVAAQEQPKTERLRAELRRLFRTQHS